MPYQREYRPREMVNTDGISLYGENAMIRMDYWTECVTVRICPAKPDSEITDGMSRFDFKSAIRLTLPAAKAMFAGLMIERELIPAIEKKEAKSFGLLSARVNMIYFSTGVEETGDVAPYIGIYTNIDDNFRPERMMTFKVSPQKYITKFNAETGEHDEVSSILMDLHTIAEFLKATVHLYGATTHAYDYRHADDAAIDTAFKTQAANRMNFALPVTKVNFIDRSQSRDPFGTRPGSTPVQSAPAAGAINLSGTPKASIAGSMDDLASLSMRFRVDGMDEDHINGYSHNTKKIRIH